MTTLDTGNRLARALDDYELFKVATHVVANNPLGTLTTVGRTGVPRTRWVAAVMGDHGLNRLYALTGRHSRKVSDLAANPSVCWMFTGPGQEEVVTITGRAVALPGLWASDGGTVPWLPLMQASQPYVLTALSHTRETAFVALEITAERIEFMSPKRGIYSPCVVPFERPVLAPLELSAKT